MTADRILDGWLLRTNLEPAIRREMRDVSTVRSSAAGRALFVPSDESSHVVVVGCGNLREYALSDEGREITLCRIGPGEVCLSSLARAFGAIAHSGHVIAETDVDLLLFPASRFRDWAERSPSLRCQTLSLLAGYTGHLVDLIEALLLPLDRRLAGVLLRGFGTEQNLSTTHVELAADAGTSREVASRYLKEFEQQGAVDLGRGVIDLRDRSVLTALRDGRPHRRNEHSHAATGADAEPS